MKIKVTSEPFNAQWYVNTVLKELRTNKKLANKNERLAWLKKTYPHCIIPESI